MKASLPLVFLSLLFIGCGGGSMVMPQPTPTPVPTITGAWSGSVVSAVFTGTAGISGNLVQGVTNPDGSIQFSGTLNLTNSCITTLTITNGLIAGGQFQLSGSTQDGSNLSVSATINATDTQITGTYSSTTGNVCNADHGSVTMTKQ